MFDLGETGTISFIRYSGSRALTSDGGHWVLWNTATGANLANGTLAAPPTTATNNNAPDLKGGVASIPTGSGMQLLSVSNGSALAKIPAGQLASDGSYAVTASTSGITVYSTAGQILASHAGNYAGANINPQPGRVFVANGPAGAAVIETLAVPSGVDTVSAPFHGQFYGWFTDGSHFFTTLSNNVWIYSDSAVQQDDEELPSLRGLTGLGNWYWIVGIEGQGSVELYDVGSAGQIVTTFPLTDESSLLVSGSTLAITSPPTGGIEVIDLAGATPSNQTYTLPLPLDQFGASAFAAASAASWLVGGYYGVLALGPTTSTYKYLGYGAAISVAGNETYVAVGTASDQIIYFNTSTGALEGTLSSAASSLLENETDLLLFPNNPDLFVGTSATFGEVGISGYTFSYTDVYSLSSGTAVTGLPTASFASFSSTGAFAAEVPQTSQPCSGAGPCAQVFQLSGGNVIWSDNDTTVAQVVISPDGTLIAATTYPENTYLPSTNIYKNARIINVVPGLAVGWIDNTHLLASQFSVGRTGIGYSGMVIYDASGNVVSSPTLPDLTAIQVVPQGFYSPETGEIYSNNALSVLWRSATPAFSYQASVPGAVAGSSVVFPSANYILKQPY